MSIARPTEAELLHPDNPTEHQDREIAPLLEIDSFLPVISQLPNVLCLADKSIHIRGAVSKADLDPFYCYTRRVGTFTLTDSSPALEGRTIPPATYIRLAQLHNLDTPLFPSLKHLRIVDANSSLTHLTLLLSNSLRSIELGNTGRTQEEVLLSFLITLADECPELSSIKLISPVLKSVWTTCLKFNHLRVLELKDVTRFNFELFSAIGQAFPQLEHFVLDARTAKYIRATTTPDFRGGDNIAELRSQILPSEHGSTSTEFSDLHADGRDYPGFESTPQHEPVYDSVESPGPTFLRLEKFHVTGSLDLIQDSVKSIPSRCLKEIGLTLVRSNRPKFPKKVGKEKRVFSGPLVRIDLETPDFVTCLDNVFNNWWHTLTSLSIGQYEDYSPSDQGDIRSAVYPTLPVAVREKILVLLELERLDISGWTIENFLERPSLSNSNYSNLKFLHLPIQSNNKGVPFSSLRLIAELFPKLVSFQSSMDDADILVSDRSNAVAHVLSHGLEILSVGNTSPNPNPKEVLDIARHIFALFPNLKEIRTYEGQNKDQWDYIHSLVQVFQGVCLDQAARSI